MANRNAATGADWQVAAFALGLHGGGRNLELRRRRLERRITNCEPADLCGCRRDTSRAASVTPSEHHRCCRNRTLNRPLAEATRRQSSNAIRSRTALAYWKRLRRYAAGLPGLGLAAAALIECSFEIAGQRFVCGGVGMRHTRRRHVPCSKLAQHLFPDGRVRCGMLDVHGIQLKIGRYGVLRCGRSRSTCRERPGGWMAREEAGAGDGDCAPAALDAGFRKAPGNPQPSAELPCRLARLRLGPSTQAHLS